MPQTQIQAQSQQQQQQVVDISRPGSNDTRQPLQQNDRDSSEVTERPSAGIELSDLRRVEIMNSAANLSQKFCNNTVITSKYTIVNFVPKCLFEQFRRVANVYFLIISLLQVGTDLSPTSKYATIIPLMGVVSVTMIKEAIEDYQRHIADKHVNSNIAKVIDKDGSLLDVAWRDVRVGDIIELNDGDGICCDGILLSSSQDQGLAYVETSMLDGETNLKVRESVWQTSSLKTCRSLSRVRGTLQCELPNANMYRFRGTLQIQSLNVDDPAQTALAAIPIGLQNFLLRGSFLRNCSIAYLLVAYTGDDTKQVRNTRATPSKRSNIDRLINSTIFLVFLTLLAMCTISTVLFSLWVVKHSSDYSVWYLPFVAANDVKSKLTSFITFLILYNNLVPISLYVTLELVKLVQAKLIENDIRMFYSMKKMAAKARTSNLNEDLGQIDHIFSDKTGTLTCNEMIFRLCSVNGIVYESVNMNRPSNLKAVDGVKVHPGEELLAILKSGSEGSIEQSFLTCMSICNTVLPEIVKTKGRLATRWQASSPDEEALVVGAIGFGYRLLRREQGHVVIQVGHRDPTSPPNDLKYTVLNVNEFTSQRKCMSVIVKTPDGDLVLFCKGADDAILNKLKPGQEQKVHTLRKHLHRFAVQGLRTLVLAQAVLDPDQYRRWNDRYQQTHSSLSDDKDEILESLSAEIESNLTSLGATGIEDRLQNGVPEAIQLLLDSNIKVWVLTGDKVETAINIGKSSTMITSDMKILRFATDQERDMDNSLKKCEQEARSANKHKIPLAMVVDGKALSLIVDNDQRSKAFVEICNLCRTVIACRTSPRQKAGIVAMVKKFIQPEPMTLAIGDGANDIGMLQEAHVGVGISGNEGMQAVNASDYAIAQFRYLCRLTLVHGNWNYRRISKVVLYSFYKNISNVFTLFFYCFYNGYSGASLYESWLQAGWNVCWTFLPVVIYGITDKDLHSTTIMTHPHVYTRGQRHLLFNLRTMAEWVAVAIIHAIIVFYLSVGSLSNEIMNPNGTTQGMILLGTIINGCMVVLVNCKMLFESKHWTAYTVGSVAFSVGFWFTFIAIYSYMITVSFDFFGVGMTIYQTILPWLVFILAPIAALMFDIAVMYIRDMYFPNPIVIANEVQNIVGIFDEDQSYSDHDQVVHIRSSNSTAASAVVPQTTSVLKKQASPEETKTETKVKEPEKRTVGSGSKAIESGSAMSQHSDKSATSDRSKKKSGNVSIKTKKTIERKESDMTIEKRSSQRHQKRANPPESSKTSKESANRYRPSSSEDDGGEVSLINR